MLECIDPIIILYLVFCLVGNITVFYITKHIAKRTLVKNASKENLPMFLIDFEKNCSFLGILNAIVWVITIIIIVVIYRVPVLF